RGEVIGSEFGKTVLVAPAIEDPVGDAETRAGVDRRRAADRATHRDRNHAVSDHAGEPTIAIELLGCGDRTLLEVTALVIVALLDQQDGHAPFGELLGDDRATGAGAD